MAFVVFVRKQHPEIQYLRATISEAQRREFGRLVETTVHQIETGHFAPPSGIRFPQNACVSCSHLGLCLGNDQLITANLIRKAGASDLDKSRGYCLEMICADFLAGAATEQNQSSVDAVFGNTLRDLVQRAPRSTNR